MALSHIFSVSTSLFDCFQNFTSQSMRSYQPFPTIPCSAGHFPVTNVDCTEVVNAGNIGVIVFNPFSAAYFLRKGVCSLIRDEDKPTMSITTVLFKIVLLIDIAKNVCSFLLLRIPYDLESDDVTHCNSRIMDSAMGNFKASGNTSHVYVSISRCLVNDFCLCRLSTFTISCCVDCNTP